MRKLIGLSSLFLIILFSSLGYCEGLIVYGEKFSFIAAYAGEDTAGKVQLYTEYYPSSVKYGRAHLSGRVPKYIKNEID